jgi:predicted RNA methylase
MLAYAALCSAGQVIAVQHRSVEQPFRSVQQACLQQLLPVADAHVLVLGADTGLLPLMATAAGAGSVTAVERTRMLYRMARQVQNRATPYTLHLNWLPVL